MDNFLGQDLTPGLNSVQVMTAEEPMIKEYKKKTILFYIVLFVYLLIPILSIEGIVGWILGISGAYKTINIYRSKEEDKNNKSIRLLIIYIMIAVVYNILVYYIQKFVAAKTV